MTSHLAMTGGGRYDATEHTDGGGFASAIWAQKTEDLPFLYRERDPVDGHKPPESLFQFAHMDHIRAGIDHGRVPRQLLEYDESRPLPGPGSGIGSPLDDPYPKSSIGA